jgi:hypothetical protein
LQIRHSTNTTDWNAYAIMCRKKLFYPCPVVVIPALLTLFWKIFVFHSDPEKASSKTREHKIGSATTKISSISLYVHYITDKMKNTAENPKSGLLS